MPDSSRKTFLNLYDGENFLCCLDEVNPANLDSSKVSAIVAALAPCLDVSGAITAKTVEGFKTITSE